MIAFEKNDIDECKRRIEEKYNLQGSSMMERDFEYLRKVILEATRTDLSTSTLRRLWSGQYQSVPQTKTLDALAQVIGHEGWHDFKNALPSKEDVGKREKKPRLLPYLISITILGGIIVSSIAFKPETVEVSLTPEVIMYNGVPATIGFNYETSNPKTEIEISWNPYERKALDPDKNFYSATYFYPDYHQAKLLLDDQILVQKNIHVTTDAWHGLVMKSGYDSRPLYLADEDFRFSDRLVVNEQTIEELGLETNKQLFPVFTLSNEALSEISCDKLSMSARVKNQPLVKGQSCYGYSILLKGAYGSMRIPISQAGCQGISHLRCSERKLTGKEMDFSSLATQVEQTHEVTLTIKDNKLEVLVEDNDPFQLDYANEMGPLKVVKFIFDGKGEVHAFDIFDEHQNRVELEALAPF